MCEYIFTMNGSGGKTEEGTERGRKEREKGMVISAAAAETPAFGMGLFELEKNKKDGGNWLTLKLLSGPVFLGVRLTLAEESPGSEPPDLDTCPRYMMKSVQGHSVSSSV